MFVWIGAVISLPDTDTGSDCFFFWLPIRLRHQTSGRGREVSAFIKSNPEERKKERVESRVEGEGKKKKKKKKSRSSSGRSYPGWEREDEEKRKKEKEKGFSRQRGARV